MTMRLSGWGHFTNRVLRRARLYSRLNRTLTVDIDGQTIQVPVSAGLQAEVTEPWMLALLRHLLALGPGHFVDVGVNLGQTLIKVKAIDPGRDYIGFEPNPVCVHYVEELIAANHWQQCQVIPAGLGGVTTIAALQLYHGRGGDSSASVVADFRPDERVTFRKNVVILSGNDLPPDLLTSAVAVVKIDVEGAEADVIDALLLQIRRDRPLISMEILPCYDSGRTDRIARQARIEAALAAADYRILRVRHAQLDGGFALEPIASIGIHGDMALCEYVMCPSEKIDRCLSV